MNFDLRLYAVTDRTWTGTTILEDQLREALEAGVTLVQLREKELDEQAFIQEAKRMKVLTDQYGVPLLINDNVSVALASGADGVHVGQDDGNAEEVRRLLGPDKILGVTVKTEEQARLAQKQGADYLGAGAVFGTSTKKNAKPMSMEQLCAITAAVSIPVVAIGGINQENIERLAGSGVAGTAVISGIFAAADIGAAVKCLRQSAEKIVEVECRR